MLVLVLVTLSSTGCYQSSTTVTLECGISGPRTDANGKVLDPNLYLTYNNPKPGRVILSDDKGHVLLAQPLPTNSRLKIGIKGESLVITAKSGKNLLQVPVSAAQETTLRHEYAAAHMADKSFAVFLHVETGSRDTVFKMNVVPLER